MRLSRAGAGLIARFEGFIPRPYDDAAGHATIGYGHLLHHGPVTQADVRRWGTISKAEGMRLLREDAREAARAVEEQVRVRLHQHQFDALVSFVFNVGAGAFGSSTLLRRLNAGERDAVPGELMRWTRAGGRELAGLVRRRREEADLWERRPPALTPREQAMVTLMQDPTAKPKQRRRAARWIARRMRGLARLGRRYGWRRRRRGKRRARLAQVLRRFRR